MVPMLESDEFVLLYGPEEETHCQYQRIPVTALDKVWRASFMQDLVEYIISGKNFPKVLPLREHPTNFSAR